MYNNSRVGVDAKMYFKVMFVHIGTFLAIPLIKGVAASNSEIHKNIKIVKHATQQKCPA